MPSELTTCSNCGKTYDFRDYHVCDDYVAMRNRKIRQKELELYEMKYGKMSEEAKYHTRRFRDL